MGKIFQVFVVIQFSRENTQLGVTDSCWVQEKILYLVISVCVRNVFHWAGVGDMSAQGLMGLLEK